MEKVRCTRNIDCFTKGNEYDYPYAINDVGQIIRLEGCSLFDMYFEKIETKEEMKEEYYLSTTITRAVKNDDPSVIMKETGKSVEEVCSWVDDTNSCIFLCGSECYCGGLSCNADGCPFNRDRLGKESAIKWLKGEIDKHGNPKNKKEEPKDIKPIPKKPLSDYDAVHVDSQEKWDFVSEKLGYHWNAPYSKWITNGKNTCINIRGCKFGVTYKSILSFEEWLDLTGHYSDWVLFKNRKQFLEDVESIYNVCNTPIKATDVIPIKNLHEETIAYFKNGELFNTKWVKIATGLTNDNSDHFESSKKDSTFVSWESESDDYVEYKALPVHHCSKVEFIPNEE